jgi:hypothetical protein
MSVRLVDTNQYIQRVREFDFDVTVQGLGQSDSPGNEQREYWHSSTADAKGSRNYMGVQDPVIDKLVEMVIQAPGREELVHRVRALDRDGTQREFDADGLLAVCIQHEIDHLDGKVFVDYLSPLKRRMIEKRLKKARLQQREPARQTV